MSVSKRFLHLLLLGFILLISCNQEKQESFTFVQMCDPQLGMGGYEHDVRYFKLAVEKINEIAPDFVIICGDLVHHASDSTFREFNDIREGFIMPAYCAPGNHDVGNTPTDSSLSIYRNLIGADYYDFRHKGYSFVICNTQLWKADCGEESERHNRWVMETLSGIKEIDSRTFVAGHYPLYLEDPDEEEKYFNLPLSKRKELLALFEQKGVVAYLSGHTHETIINNYKGIQLVSGETTSKNFDKRPMVFRIWNVSADSVWHMFQELE